MGSVQDKRLALRQLSRAVARLHDSIALAPEKEPWSELVAGVRSAIIGLGRAGIGLEVLPLVMGHDPKTARRLLRHQDLPVAAGEDLEPGATLWFDPTDGKAYGSGCAMKKPVHGTIRYEVQGETREERVRMDFETREPTAEDYAPIPPLEERLVSVTPKLLRLLLLCADHGGRMVEDHRQTARELLYNLLGAGTRNEDVAERRKLVREAIHTTLYRRNRGKGSTQ